MKQKNKFQRMVRFFCTLFIITFTFLFFMPLVSALDNDENMQQDDNSELQLSQDASIQTSSSQKNEVQTKNIASGKFGTSEWVIDNSGCLHIGEGTFAPVSGISSPWKNWAQQITSIVIDGNVTLDQKSAHLFSDLSKVETISNLSNFDTSQVKDMSYMFRGMIFLKKLDLSSFDTSQVTNMSYMFEYTMRLTELDVSKFNTSKVKDMGSMFRHTDSLKEINVSSFDTSEVMIMSSMFEEGGAEKLNLSRFNTSKVTSMSNMFSNMRFLTEVDLSSFDTSKVSSMTNMFRNTQRLSQLRLGKNFKFIGGTVSLLPPVPTTDEYNGKWINVDSGTVDNPSGTNIWTSDELMTNYSGMRDADTYVWQKKSFITEYYYDTEGNSLKDPVVTEMDSMTFTPHPEKYEEVDDTLYIYKGWSEEPPESASSIHEGNPPSTTVEATYYYVYEKADKYINVTVPTEIVFGTENNSKNITSKNYDIKNNSNDVDLQMMLASFDKVNSDIQLLEEVSPDPSGKENSARLNLLVGGKTVLSSLNEKVSEQELGNIQSGKTTTLALTGTYFGDLSERHKVEYKTNLKFKAQAKVEN
ncbi:BspA family leucine-rich repeat surface protein [Lactococcus petauri]|uniref:BspA family leucine-rich repeat surface protein n=1 Tax=Lactococcus petauri TaxID=1940789 RepID=UPI0030D0DCD7